MSAAMEEEPELVVAAEDMNSENFALHLEHRHPESLAGLLEIWFNDDYIELCYRAFHRQLHKFRHNLEHEHLEA